MADTRAIRFKSVLFVLFLANLNVLLIYRFISNTPSSMVRVFAHGAMDRQIDPSCWTYFLFQPVLHDWCNNSCGMSYPVCGTVHIKEPLLLIRKSSLYGGS